MASGRLFYRIMKNNKEYGYPRCEITDEAGHP